MHKPVSERTHVEQLQTFTRLVTVSKSGGKGRKRRNKTYHQVYYKWMRVPI